nr:Gag-Pol polyprotein [Tanacetum cinerariifolium]
MHTFYQLHPSEHRWTKDHPLEQVIGNPSQSVKTRHQLESNGEMCMFALTVSRTEPKNIKEAMADSVWIESMQIKRYIDTKPNHELIYYCLTNPPYKLDWIDKEVPISEGSPITRTKRFQEMYKNVSQEIRNQLNAEAEAVQIILTGIDNDIYSTVDACPNACEMWKAIERLKQGE